MIIVTVNSGSTSVKLAAFEAVAPGKLSPVTQRQHSDAQLVPREVLAAFLSESRLTPDVVAHRVVHGGTRFDGPTIIDSAVLEKIRELSELAPLHNPKAIAWIEASQAITAARVTQVALFDTAFFARMPRIAAEYALDRRYGADLGVRRYGFHGLAHQAMSRRWAELHPELSNASRVITLQLGGGCSAAAIEHGSPIDTSMGFSPLEGLVMATRSGDLDPAAVPYLQHRLAVTSEQVIEILNRHSGLDGMCAGVTRLDDLLADPAPDSRFAVDLYCYRARKYIGAYLAVLAGCDGIVFGGGVGEHVPQIRSKILAGMGWAGIRLDAAANEATRGQEARIEAEGAKVSVHVIPVDEERVLAEAASATAIRHT